MSRLSALVGPVHYEPRTKWGPAGALVTLVVYWLLLTLLAMLVLIAAWGIAAGLDPVDWKHLIPMDGSRTAGPNGSLARSKAPPAIVFELLGFLALIATTLRLGQAGGGAVDVLALRRPRGGGRVLLIVAAVASVDLAIAIGVALIAPVTDAAAAQQLAQTWTSGGRTLEVLTVVVVGPIAEELAFRGFLLPALARTRLGFWGAALVTSALFTATHGYQFAPLLFVQVFIGGIVYAWALGLTGSVWVPIALHMILNLTATSLSWAFS